MRCNKLCKYFDEEQGVCGAFPQRVGLDCGDLLPCEIERHERRKESARKCQKKRRENALHAGYCVICARRPARPHRRTCAECSARISAINKKKKSPE